MIHRDQQNIQFTFISRPFERSIERRPDATDYNPQFDIERLLHIATRSKINRFFKQRNWETEVQ